MTNEDLVREIQAGQTELIEQLWSQVRPFVAWKALQRYVFVTDPGAVSVEDLVQEGYFAVVSATKAFDPEKGSFLTILTRHLKTAFNRAAGTRSERQRRDPIHQAMSLDEPIDAHDPDSTPALDFQPHPENVIDKTDDLIYQQQLRGQLDRLLKRLSPKAADVIRSTLILDEPIAHVAERYHTTPGRIISSRSGYLVRLRELSRSTREGMALRRFVDDSTDWFRSVGPEQFTRTQTSAVESLAIQREHLERIYLRRELQ